MPQRAGASAAPISIMNVLAIDTASPQPAVALWSGARIFEQRLSTDRRSSEDLLPAVQRVLAAAGLSLRDCARIAVCAGPGSFTGVRIGLATSWGFGRALEIPAEPVSTLEAMAEAARPAGAATLTAVLDAGRGELIMERFAMDGERARSLGPPVRLAEADLPARASSEVIVALPASLAGGGGATLPMSVAAGLALAVSRAPRGENLPLHAIYARPSAAEEKRGAP